MKGKAFALICAVLALMLALTGAAEELNEETKQRLDDVMDGIVDRDDGRSLAGLAIEAISDGEVVYKYAGGRRVIDNDDPANDLPFETDTRVRIASVSKTFVAVGIMQLAEQGKIDLDADVSEYLGFELRLSLIHI